jgi:hypothetical protein
MILPVALLVNIVTLLDTWRAYRLDGYEGIGWPVPFLERGGFSYEVHTSFLALILDLSFCLAVALLTGVLFRDGGRKFVVVITKFMRGYGGARKGDHRRV